MKDDKTRQAIILGALLHDIGKFAQRGLPKGSGSHAELGAEFFQNHLREKVSYLLSNDQLNYIESAIRDHHQEGVVELISQADRLSAAMDRIPLKEEERGDPRFERLESLFEKIHLPEKPSEEIREKKSEYTYQLTSLSLQRKDIFPDKFLKESLQEKYKILWDKFVGETQNLPTENINIFISSLYYLLWKYTWCVPSAAYKSEADISLFDHLKTTTAIAVSLQEAEKDAFLIVGADISGIQKFLYKLASPEEGMKGMAQRLRGRSFYLSIMVETFAHFILDKLDLPIPNLLWCGGGDFAILSPDIGKVKEKLNECKTTINEWLYNEFQGELYLVLEKTSANGAELKNFATIVEKLNGKIAIAKKKRFFDLKQERKFSLKKSVCIICGKDFEGRNKLEKICPECHQYEEIGTKLPEAQYLMELKSKEDLKVDIAFEKLGVYWKLEKEIKNIPRESTLYRINNLDFLSDTSFPLSYGFKFLGKVVPKDKNNNILTFEDMEKQNKGAEFLGILRMDVDNLGAIFNIGLKENKSISRICTLSRTLDWFFSGYLNEICKQYETLYITYSGGDDLFMVGSWEEIVKGAKEISDKFKKYSCYNPDLHISAGILLCKYRFPIGRAANLAGEKLNRMAKAMERKNAICIFEQAIYWSRFTEVLELGEEMIKEIKDKRLSRGFLYALLGLYQKHIGEEKEELVWLPKFLYALQRNVKKEIEEGKPNPIFAELQNKIPTLSKELPALVAYVALKTRRKQNARREKRKKRETRSRGHPEVY